MAKTTPLTDKDIKNAKPESKVRKLSDGRGLQLRIRSNGTKSWLLDYVKPSTGKRSSLGLGSYPEISLAAARKLRDEARELIAKDIDPKEHKDAEKRQKQELSANTLAKVAKSWFEVKKSSIKPDTASSLWRSIELHVLPSLGGYPISQITAPLVIETLKPIAAKGTLETVKRLTQRMNEIMTFAVNTGLIFSNPLSGIGSAFQKPVKNNMATLEPKELPEFLNDLQYASIKLVTRLLIEWQLHTMVRPSEAAAASWKEIDLENKLWIIPAERMKRGREHIVPLSSYCLKILERIQPISGHRPYVFPSDRKPLLHTNEQTANMAIKRMGYKGRLVAHGLRSLASTILNEEGFDPDLIESALAHVDKNEVRRAYNRAKYLERRKEMMEWWSDYLIKAKALTL
ncbi:MAG: tyrosine-type recombinase/integrase [Gammaproteobacteria bacterium]|nr:tyrosine-type recombinase/integrase [Gammaproteobacteria bacterium]